MKNKREILDFSRLRRKVFLQMLLMIVIAGGSVILLYLLVQGKFANTVVNIFIYLFHLDYESAARMFHYAIRNNMEAIMILAFATFFMIFFRFSLSWFTRYFSEVSSGIDAVMNGTEIVLSPEMDFFEKRLNTVKQTLDKRDLEVKLAEQRKNDLVMYLAHDIKTPLTSVIGYLSLLDEAQDMPIDQKAKYVHITLDKAYRLEHLINEFFEITRYNLQSITLEKCDVDISYMLIQMADEFYPSLASKEMKIVMNTDEMTLKGDPDKLARVFNNIFKNAIAYSDPNTAIEVSAKACDGMAVLKFSNTGETIPSDRHIFDKFYRLDDARQTHTGGAGLGLAIAKEIVLLHDGQIDMKSENRKTVFTVTLPL